MDFAHRLFGFSVRGEKDPPVQLIQSLVCVVWHYCHPHQNTSSPQLYKESAISSPLSPLLLFSSLVHHQLSPLKTLFFYAPSISVVSLPPPPLQLRPSFFPTLLSHFNRVFSISAAFDLLTLSTHSTIITMLRQTLNRQATASLKNALKMAPTATKTSTLAAVAHTLRVQTQAIRHSSSSSNQPKKYRAFHTSDVQAQAREVPGFPVLDDPLVHNHSIPSFMVGTQNGFLPRQDPLDVLPKEYEALEELLQKMPLTLKDGSKGLLALGQFGEACKSLPQYDLSKVEDSELLSGKLITLPRP